jgi:hypothetical protein
MHASMAMLALIDSKIWSRNSFCWQHQPSSILVLWQWLPFHLQNNSHPPILHTPLILFYCLEFPHLIILLQWCDECQQGVQNQILAFQLAIPYIFIPSAKMRWWDDEITLITNPSHWGMRQCGRGWVDMIVLGVSECGGSDSWSQKFWNTAISGPLMLCWITNHLRNIPHDF